MKQTVSGIIKSVELKSRKPFKNYGSSEKLEFYADIAIETDQDTVYFKSPAVTRCVATGGPFAIVTYHFPARGNGFIREIEGNAVAEPGKPNTNRLELTVKVGDTITVEGTRKASRVSRKGNPYRVFNRVILLDKSDS